MIVRYFDKDNNELTLEDLKDKVIEDNVAWTQTISAVFKRLEKEGVISTSQ